MSSTLIERLRVSAQSGREIIEPWDHDPYLFDEAADAIEKLRDALQIGLAILERGIGGSMQISEDQFNHSLDAWDKQAKETIRLCSLAK